MNKTILFISLCLFFNIILAQNKTKAEVLQLIAEDTCECIKSDPETFSTKTSMSKKEVAIGLCMIKSYTKRKKLSKELRKKNIDIELLGEEVGMYMIESCGIEFMSIFNDEELDKITDDSLEDIPPPPSLKSEHDFTMEGKLTSINNDAISYIIVSDQFSKNHVFVIVNQFEGLELLSESSINKNIKVYYEENDYFDLSEQRYVKKKVIKYLEN